MGRKAECESIDEKILQQINRKWKVSLRFLYGKEKLLKV